jgi:hypothetical protein
MKIIIPLILFIFITVKLNAQTATEKIPEVKHSIKGEFKLPHPLHNKVFKNIIDGIADVSVYYQYPVNNLTIGGGFKFIYMQINDVKVNEKLAAGMQGYTPFAKIGYEKFISPKIHFELSARGGYSLLYFTSRKCTDNGEKSKPQNAPFAETQVAIYMLANERLSFGLLSSYNFIFNKFTPDLLCLPNFPGFTAEDSKGNYRFFSVGFGFSFFLVPGPENSYMDF